MAKMTKFRKMTIGRGSIDDYSDAVAAGAGNDTPCDDPTGTDVAMCKVGELVPACPR